MFSLLSLKGQEKQKIFTFEKLASTVFNIFAWNMTDDQPIMKVIAISFSVDKLFD